jgi:hypothetical protein
MTVLANPSRPVQVLHDGRWVSGWLEAYRREADGWRGKVRYTPPAPGMQFLQWRPADQMRQGNAQ